MKLELSDQEVANLMTILTQSTGQPWVVTHPLIMKIGQQQQAQTQALEALQPAQPQEATGRKGNSHDRSDLDEERGGSVRAAGRGASTA